MDVMNMGLMLTSGGMWCKPYERHKNLRRAQYLPNTYGGYKCRCCGSWIGLYTYGQNYSEMLQFFKPYNYWTIKHKLNKPEFIEY